jgi:single-strand DNA-binding protein
MARSVNKVTLIGNVGWAPEVRFTQDGMKVVHFSVTTHETWKDKNTSEQKDHTEWHQVVVMNERVAEIAAHYLKKGSRVYLEGQLRTRQWKDQKGQERYIT